MKRMALLFIFVFTIILLPLPVFAVDFSIENSEINAYLQENGDVEVSEQHTYQFDDDFNGITRTLIPKEETQIINFEASENNEILDVEQEENLYKVYRSGSDEKITVDLSYTISNGVEVFSDLAQFYWPFFDTSNESTYQNMDIYVHPPQSTEEVLALGYDEAYGTSTTNSDGVVHFAMGEVASGSNGDIRVAYNPTLFPSASLIENNTIREEIAADKLRLEEEAAAFKSRQEVLNLISPYIVGLFTISLIVLFFRTRSIKNRRLWEVERSSSPSYLLPNQEMSLPATMLYMRNMYANSDFLSAALLDLVRKGYVKREDDSNFTVVDSNTDHPHESILINWLFYKIGEKEVFSLTALESYTKNEDNHSTYNNDFHKWIESVKDETKGYDLVDKQKGLRWTSAVAGILLIPFIIILGVHSLFMWMFFSICLSLTLLVFAAIYQPRTVQGLRIRQQWKDFSSNYDNIGEKEWKEWMSDTQMQAFIYALGTGNKSMQKKSEQLSKRLSPTVTTDTNTQTIDIVMFILIAGTINNQFDQANSTVSASTSSSSGSVPGGGAGVGGGGGGSGAF
ncbi:DUF2207 domain-containing protein [Gracilibacillus kekensis]|uniref:Uncharacterized membrane protein n=1 Tax=Gracilibacillus kekensis TaxID=1027249 RepID=A0A1M7QGJ3_9BACI|nr:DUF2207 domain-containing protein [Gracilibacillus kekensis]SHN30069.1 Uncharacterized membrane protein [Gracilibacillus kekensis]